MTRRVEKASRSRLMQDIIAEFDDRPEASTAHGGAADGYGGENPVLQTMKERQHYEEENFVRLHVKQRERKAMEKSQISRFEDEFDVRRGAWMLLVRAQVHVCLMAVSNTRPWAISRI